MTEMSAPATQIQRPDLSGKRLKKRYAAEARFRLYGLIAVFAAVGTLALLLFSIISNGYTAFAQHHIALEVTFDPEAEIDPTGERDPNVLRKANYRGLARAALRDSFPDVTERRRETRPCGFDERQRRSDAARYGAGRSRCDRHDPNRLGQGLR